MKHNEDREPEWRMKIMHEVMKQEMKIQKLGMKIMKQNERESDTIYWVLSHEFQRERSWIEMTRNDMKRTCDSKTINDMTYERFYNPLFTVKDK